MVYRTRKNPKTPVNFKTVYEIKAIINGRGSMNSFHIALWMSLMIEGWNSSLDVVFCNWNSRHDTKETDSVKIIKIQLKTMMIVSDSDIWSCQTNVVVC